MILNSKLFKWCFDLISYVWAKILEKEIFSARIESNELSLLILLIMYEYVYQRSSHRKRENLLNISLNLSRANFRGSSRTCDNSLVNIICKYVHIQYFYVYHINMIPIYKGVSPSLNPRITAHVCRSGEPRGGEFLAPSVWSFWTLSLSLIPLVKTQPSCHLIRREGQAWVLALLTLLVKMPFRS